MAKKVVKKSFNFNFLTSGGDGSGQTQGQQITRNSQATGRLSDPDPIRLPAPTPMAPIQPPIIRPSSTWDKIKAFDVKGLGNELGIGLAHGLSNTGSAKMDRYMANSSLNRPGPLQSYYQGQLADQQKRDEYLKANPVNSLPAMLAEQLPLLPLWITGEGAIGALGKGLAKLSPRLAMTAERVSSKLPGIVKGGLMDAATYGTVVAPVENIQQGGNLQSLIEKEKQLPGVLLGGTLARGAFKGLGEGARLGRDVIGEGGSLKQALAFRKINLPELRSNPLQDVQNAYKTPPLRDINANIKPPIAPNETIPVPIGEGRVAGETPGKVTSLSTMIDSPAVDDAVFWNKVKVESGFKGDTLSLQTAVETGGIDISELSMKMDLQKFANTAELRRVEPNIPVGLKERGVSKNIRTDLNRPDELRDSFSADPLVYKQLGNKETLAKAQSIFDEGFDTARNQVDELLAKGKPEAAPLTKMLADKLTNEGDIAGARELMSNAATRATEAGQFGQAFRILREADPETFLMTFDKGLKKLNKEGLETYGKKWKNVDLTPDELTKIGKIERGNQKSYDDVMEQIQARIANEMPATGMEKFIAWRHIAMLLNTTTNIRNVGGNALMMAMRKATQRVEGVLQKATPKAGRTQAVFINKEYKQLATDHFKVHEKELLSGGNKYRDNITMGMENKRVFRKSRIGEKFGKDIDILDKTRKLTYDLLQKGDTPFFRNAYVDRLASYAQSKGIKDFSKLGQEAFDIAKKEALESTYKDMNVLATSLNKFKRPGLDASNLRKGIAVGVEVAFPFVKTPINLIQRGVDYTPLSLITGFGKMVSKKSAIAGINDITKGMVGTGIVGLGYMLASNGILTGKSEKDKDLREYNAATGREPFSIMGKYSFDWALPISIPLIIGVEIYNSTHESEEEKKKMDSVINGNDDSKLWTAISNTLGGVSNSIEASGEATLNMSMLQTFKRLIGNSKGYLEGVKDLPKNLVSQMIPSMLGKFAAMADPLVRTQYVQGDRLSSLKNATIAKIPFASKSLQPKQTPFGEDVKKIENIPSRVLSQFLSPGIIAKDQNINPKIDTELRRLNNVEGLKTQFPTMVPNYIEKTQTHPRITLTPTETTQYQKRVGELTLSSFGQVIGSSEYRYALTNEAKNKSADEVRADLLAEAISKAKALAKKEILKSRGLK